MTLSRKEGSFLRRDDLASERTRLQFQRYFVLACLIHVATICVVYPLPKLFDADLPYHVDYSYWLYNSRVIDAFLRDSWQMWGYNPYLSAGYPEGGVVGHLAHHGGRAWELVVHLLSPISFAFGFKLYPFLCMILPPFIVWWTCKTLRFTTRQAALTGIVSIFYWWSSQLSVIAVDRGSVSSTIAAFIAVPLIVRFALYCRAPGWYHAIILLVLSVVGIWLHPYTAAIVALPIIVIYFYHFASLPARHHLVLFGLLFLVALSTLPWTIQIPTVRYHDFSPQTFPFSGPLGLRVLVQNVLGISGPLFIALPACFGLKRWYHGDQRDLAVGWSAGLVFLIFLTYLGPNVPGGLGLPNLENLQPARFEVVCYVLLLLPWAHGLGGLASWLHGTDGRGGLGEVVGSLRGRRRRAGLGALAAWLRSDRGRPAARMVVAVLLAGSFVHSSWRYLEHAVYDPVVSRQRVVVPMSSTGEAFLTWAQQSTTRDGRILFEDWIGWEDGYNLVPGALALRSNREFIGGPYWDLSQSRAIFSTYVDGWVFGRRIDAFQSGELRDYLELYNIEWVACVSNVSISYFDGHPELVGQITTIGPMKIYSVNRSASFFQQGGGEVQATFNRLSLKQMQVGQEVVLRYHWLPSLRSSDGSPLRGVRVLDDPNDFIAVTPRSSELTISNEYAVP